MVIAEWNLTKDNPPTRNDAPILTSGYDEFGDQWVHAGYTTGINAFVSPYWMRVPKLPPRFIEDTAEVKKD